MIKIHWHTIDPKYKYAAQDSNGDIFAYTQEPYLRENGSWDFIGLAGGDLQFLQPYQYSITQHPSVIRRNDD